MRDNGVWLAALKRPNVETITDAIAEITPAGLKTRDGREFAVDVIIYGTGFTASEFLEPMRFTGKGGIDLHAQWAGDARAYLGVTVPNFPNLFIMYGPNTNIVVNGSIIFFSECEIRYIQGLLELLLRSQRQRHRGEDRRARRLQREGRRDEQADGLGRAAGHELVQEQKRPRVAELAVAAGRLLERDAAPNPEDYELSGAPDARQAAQ